MLKLQLLRILDLKEQQQDTSSSYQTPKGRERGLSEHRLLCKCKTPQENTYVEIKEPVISIIAGAKN